MRSICVASLLLLALAPEARAYCIYNETKDRGVVIEQETHPDELRNDRRMRVTLAPGARQCCDFHQLDCNPGGRENSTVGLIVTIAGEPQYLCATDHRDPFVKVTGAGTIRIQPNPRRSSNPYIARIYTREGKDLTGPAGLACPEWAPKPESNPKGKSK